MMLRKINTTFNAQQKLILSNNDATNIYIYNFFKSIYITFLTYVCWAHYNVEIII